MDICFNCHGLSHGRQGERAPGKCSLCHKKGFELKPKSHSKKWIGSEHKTENSDAVNKCGMCHKQTTCNECHGSKNIKPVEIAKLKGVKGGPSNGRWVDTKGDVTMSKCLPCHTDFDRTKFATLNFKHSVHFNKKITCKRCHLEFPHSRGDDSKPRTKIPNMRTCFSCHGLSHGNQGTFAPGDCSKCHPATFERKPKSHDKQWVSQAPKRHKFEAKKDRNYCFMCHKQEFCNSCHGLDPIPHEEGWKDLHGTTAAKLADINAKKIACNNCHQPQQFCVKCHKGVTFPHPDNWSTSHGKTATTKGKDACYTCHRESLCQSCHRGVSMPHKANWLGEHRTFLRVRSVNQCLGCHTRPQCVQCHSAHKVHNRNTIYTYPIPEDIR